MLDRYILHHDSTSFDPILADKKRLIRTHISQQKIRFPSFRKSGRKIIRRKALATKDTPVKIAPPPLAQGEV
jgi:hypothetical protein